MSLLDRFMGRPTADDSPDELVAVESDQSLSLQVLFPGPFDLDGDALTLALRGFHTELAAARAELMALRHNHGSAATVDLPGVVGLVGWGKHVVKVAGFHAAIPHEVFDRCVRPSHFSDQLKQEAARHQSHILLYYAGSEPDPLEQYVALAVVAVALARFDAMLILNETARAAFPAEVLLADEGDADPLAMLRVLPIPLLYGGFVKLEVAGESGVWMRTFGNHLLNLPDLALHADGHHQGGETFDLFANMLAYLRETGARFETGHTVQIGDGTYLRLRAPTSEEYFLESAGTVLVAERIGVNEINSPGHS